MCIRDSACSKGHQPINYGEDECEFCKMMVMDKRYGAELVTDKGKIYFFDSIECLAVSYTHLIHTMLKEAK